MAHCMIIFSIWVFTLSKFSIYIKLLSNDICIYFDALIKFKEFVYIYVRTGLGTSIVR